jgi:hypothetical protein
VSRRFGRAAEALRNRAGIAMNKALENAIPPRRVVERAWMEIF